MNMAADVLPGLYVGKNGLNMLRMDDNTFSWPSHVQFEKKEQGLWNK